MVDILPTLETCLNPSKRQVRLIFYASQAWKLEFETQKIILPINVWLVTVMQW